MLLGLTAEHVQNLLGTAGTLRGQHDLPHRLVTPGHTAVQFRQQAGVDQQLPQQRQFTVFLGFCDTHGGQVRVGQALAFAAGGDPGEQRLGLEAQRFAGQEAHVLGPVVEGIEALHAGQEFHQDAAFAVGGGGAVLLHGGLHPELRLVQPVRQGVPDARVVAGQQRVGGIFAAGYAGGPHPEFRAQHLIQPRQGGFQPGLVVVEHHHQAVHAQALQQGGVLGGQGRAQGRDRAREAVLVHGDHVHVPFHHHQFRFCLQARAGLVQAVQQLTLLEGLGLRGVQVLGLAVVQHAPAEAHQAAQVVADGEHHAAPEAVVHPPVLGVLDQQARFQQLPLADAPGAGQFQQAVPALGRVPQLEGRDGLVGQATALQVVQGRPRQVLAEVTQCKSVDVIQVTAGFLAVLRLDLHACLLGQFAQRVPKGQVLGALHETEHVPARLAAEAVEVPLLGIHLETGAFLLVEGAQALQAAFPGGGELHILADDLRDVQAGTNVFFGAQVQLTSFTARLK